MEGTQKKNLIPFFIVSVMLIARLISDFIWIHQNNFPFCSYFLTVGYGFADKLSNEGIISFIGSMFNETYYPPLLQMIIGFLQSFMGHTNYAVPIANAVLYLPGLWAMQSIAYSASGKNSPGYLACALLLFTPQIALFSRAPVLDVSVVPMTAIVLWGVLKSEQLTKKGPLIIAGVGFGIGMMIKWSFVITIFPFLIIAIAEAGRSAFKAPVEEKRKVIQKQIVSVGIASLFALAILGPWYVKSLDYQFIFATSGADPAHGNFWVQISLYLQILFTKSFGFIIAGAFLLLTPVLFFRPRERTDYYLIIGFWLGYFFLILVPHKFIRYITPLYPVCFLSIALAFQKMKRKQPYGKWAAALLAMIIIIAAGYRFVNMTIIQEIFPAASGETIQYERACLKDFNVFQDKILRYMEKKPFSGKTPTFAIHPFTQGDISFNLDLMYYIQHLNSVNKGSPFLCTGYEPMSYQQFEKEFSDRDLIIVEKTIWSMPDNLKNHYFHSVYPDLENSDSPPSDFLFQERISQKFHHVDTVEGRCVGELEFYLKKPQTY